MKNGKKPTREQRKAMMLCGLDPHEWFVIKSMPNELHIINKEDGSVRVVKDGVCRGA